MNHRICIVSIAALLIIALTGFTSATLAQQGQGGGMGNGPGGGAGPGYRGGCGGGFWSQLTDEQRTQLTELRDRFWKETEALHQNARQKRLALRGELAKQAPDAEMARQVQKELSEIKAQLAQERISYVLEAKKITPEADRFFRGKDRGFGRAGKGPGGCGGCRGGGDPSRPRPDCPYL